MDSWLFKVLKCELENDPFDEEENYTGFKRQRIIKDKRKILKVTRMMMEGKKIGNMDGILLGNKFIK